MISDLPPIEWLMQWYRSQCDGDWEHQNGIRIGTLDNPGWSLEVDLAETELTGRSVLGNLIERSEDDWISVKVTDDVFHAYGGPGNLSEMIELFAAFVEGRLKFE